MKATIKKKVPLWKAGELVCYAPDSMVILVTGPGEKDYPNTFAGVVVKDSEKTNHPIGRYYNVWFKGTFNQLFEETLLLEN